jgi:hypothetical protein
LNALLGPDHVLALEAAYKGAIFVANPRTAADQIRDVCRRFQTFHAQEARDRISMCSYELGWLAEERGDATEARAAMQRVDNERKPIAQAYLAAFDGKLDAAAVQAKRAAAGLDSEWWNKFYAGDGYLFAAICADRLHRRNEAIAAARMALATFDQLSVIKEAPYYLRRTARARALLAHLLAPADPAEASTLARAAATWYRAAGGYEEVATELEKIARNHR